MSTLDSRVLKHVDRFAQQFPRAGKVSYQLSAVVGLSGPEERSSFSIEVGEKRRGESRQHDVVVRKEAGALVAEPAHLRIEAGDMVLWYTTDATLPGFLVCGEGAGVRLDSTTLESRAVFSHAFGSPGRYEWMDANGTEVRGVVEVASPDPNDAKACRAWLKELSQGTLIHIVDGQVKPERTQIMTGQTVFWAVESAPGITITDARLLGANRPQKAAG